MYALWIVFVLLYFFFWSLGCLFFLDMRILITPLVSSNSSYIISLYFKNISNTFENELLMNTIFGGGGGGGKKILF